MEDIRQGLWDKLVAAPPTPESVVCLDFKDAPHSLLLHERALITAPDPIKFGKLGPRAICPAVAIGPTTARKGSPYNNRLCGPKNSWQTLGNPPCSKVTNCPPAGSAANLKSLGSPVPVEAFSDANAPVLQCTTDSESLIFNTDSVRSSRHRAAFQSYSQTYS